ncbi:hypothetical protein EXH51_12170 [Pelomonas saccharophila]|nr:hypothetical protein [Roseateles saccharophilus]
MPWAVNADGEREVLGLKVGASEAELFLAEFLRGLNRRGLRGGSSCQRQPPGRQSGRQQGAQSKPAVLPLAFHEECPGACRQGPDVGREQLDAYGALPSPIELKRGLTRLTALGPTMLVRVRRCWWVTVSRNASGEGVRYSSCNPERHTGAVGLAPLLRHRFRAGPPQQARRHGAISVFNRFRQALAVMSSSSRSACQAETETATMLQARRASKRAAMSAALGPRWTWYLSAGI